MFKILTVFATFALFANTAIADSFTSTGRVVRIDPVYTYVNRQNPVQVCNDVEVPIYGNSGTNTEGAIVGGLIGGLIGNQFGNGSGKQAMTGVGAITGAIIGGNNSNSRQITGYRTERQCETQYRNVRESVVNEYDIMYNIDGREVTFRLNRAQGEHAYIGQRKNFRIRYQPLD